MYIITYAAPGDVGIYSFLTDPHLLIGPNIVPSFFPLELPFLPEYLRA